MTRILSAVFAILLSGSTLACSCMQQPEDIDAAVRDAYENASAVLVAQVESIKEVEIPEEYGDGSFPPYKSEITEFSEVESWKGNHAKRFYTAIVTECCTCGIRFENGRRYLLYLSKPDKNGFYSTNSCTRTKPIEEADEDIDALNRIKASGANMAPPAR